MTQRAAFKKFEKDSAEFLDIDRTSTDNMGHGADVSGKRKFEAEKLIVGECKLRDKFPGILYEMIAQAESYCEGNEDALPIALLKKKRAHIGNTIVAMKMSDFVKLFKQE